MKKCLNFRFIGLLLILLMMIFSCSDAGIDPDYFDPETETETERNINEEENEEDEEQEDAEDEEDEEDALGPSAELIGGIVVSGTQMVFAFSSEVIFLSVSLSLGLELETEVRVEGNFITVVLEEEIEPGLRFTAELEVEDEWGNVFIEKIDLISKNNRVPQLRINELRTEHDSSSGRVEFIEFYMLTEGNLGGLQVFIESNPSQPIVYEFSPIEVNPGEYVVLHLRTLSDESVDEYGDDLGESGGVGSSATARDFWIPGSTKLLRKTDIVYVMDQDGNVLSAVMISETQDSFWDKDYFIKAAGFLHDRGAWTCAEGGIAGPADAVSSADIRTSTTRSISRDETAENTKTAADWYITANSGATPGLPNNPSRLQ
ncbi:MAG: hypothetical protein FWG77_05225 [Treponema sp.]|nr:hypothetical protein [Treponema sp.]